jgi:hypothetical protein
MPANHHRSPARVAVLILLVVLAGGCAGKDATSTGASQTTTTTAPTTVAATTTTIPPMTAEELAWLKAVTTLSKKLEKAFSATSVYLTRAKMTSYANTLRSCSRELARIGSPGDRLEPVYVLVKKACGTFDKGAKCWATAARVSMADGGVVAGTPAERTQRKAIECGSEAQGNGLNLLTEAKANGEEIKVEAG